MKGLIATGLLLCGLAYGQAGGSNFACVLELPLPAYPPLSRAARVQGEVSASATVSPAGKAQDLAVVGPLTLKSTVQQALELARFDPACIGKTIRLVISFELTKIVPENQQPKQETLFVAPNKFRITSEQQIVPVNP